MKDESDGRVKTEFFTSRPKPYNYLMVGINENQNENLNLMIINILKQLNLKIK